MFFATIISNDSAITAIAQVPASLLGPIHARQKASPSFLSHGVNQSRCLAVLSIYSTGL